MRALAVGLAATVAGKTSSTADPCDGFDLYLGRFDLFGAKQDKPFGKLGLLARFLNVLVGTATWPQHKHCSGD